MTKEQVNTIIINGLKSKGIFIGSISPEVLNAFANITYEAINYTRSCTELKCGECDCKPKYENIGCDTLKDCKKEW